MYYPREEVEEDGPMSFVQGVSLVTLGGALGLTAAAAARWLNGGDFRLFPHPTNPSLRTTGGEARCLVLQEPNRQNSDLVDEEEEGDQDEYEEDEYTEDEQLVPAVQEKLLHQLESVSETLKSHVAVQEKLFQKLASNNSAITDSSMNLLRSTTTSSVNDKATDKGDELRRVWAQLVEIKAEMRSLHPLPSNGDRSPWEEKVANLLPRLESCIEKVEGSIDTNKDKPSNSSSSPRKIPAKEEVQTPPSSILPDSPSTPVVEASDLKSQPPTGTSCTLRQAIHRLAEENEATALRVGCQLLYLYIVNLSGNPDNPRYRKIFTCNESFQKVENLKGAKDLLFVVGFEEQKGVCLEWLPNGSSEQEIQAIARLKEAAAALSILKSGKKSDDLTEAALAVLSVDPNDALQIPVPPPPPTDETEDVPQTPATSLVLPPLPKKTPLLPPSTMPANEQI
jgi:hypothetical protein